MGCLRMRPLALGLKRVEPITEPEGRGKEGVMPDRHEEGMQGPEGRDTDTPVTEDHVNAALPALEQYLRDAQAHTGMLGVSVAVVFQD
jgi:hypothetical protein